MSVIKPGSLVRAVTLIGGGAGRTVYALVLNVSQYPEADYTGTDGEPALTLAFMDSNVSDKRLSGPDWGKEFIRHVGVPHSSAAVVKAGAQSVYWLDVLPAAGEALDAQKVDAPVASLGAEPFGNTRTPKDARTGTSVVSDGQGAFIIVLSDDVAVVNKDTDQPRRFTSVDEAVEYQGTLPAAAGPVPVTAEGKTQEQLDAEQEEITKQLDEEGAKRDGVATEMGHTLPVKPTDVGDATGELGSSESLAGNPPGADVLKGGPYSVVEENGEFFVKDEAGDYLLDEETEAAKQFPTREEAQSALDTRQPFAPPVENDGATKVVEAQ